VYVWRVARRWTRVRSPAAHRSPLDVRVIHSAVCPTNFSHLPICLSVLSCDRPYYLKSALSALQWHLDRNEPCLDYELHWIDQATIDRQYFLSRYRFHKTAFYYRRQGIPMAFLQAISFCTLPYILFVEEDRVMHQVSIPLISHAIELLRLAPFNIYGVVLQQEPVVGEFGGPVRLWKNLSSPYPLPSEVWQFLSRRYMWVNAGTVYRMANVLAMVAHRNYRTEEDFSDTAKQLRFTPIFLKLGPGHRPPPWTPGFFTHLGWPDSTNRLYVCRRESFS
jgi:hypothetical protein